MTKLCPYMSIELDNTNNVVGTVKCYFIDETGAVGWHQCLADMYDLQFVPWTKRKEAKEYVKEVCTMHYSYEEIKKIQRALIKRAQASSVNV